jgi:hypothetical protein
LKKAKLLQDATTILTALGMPRAQQNDRSALTLLALLDLKPGRDTWAGADNARLLRIRDVLDFCRTVFKLPYAENTRETFRRQTMHQLVEAGVALYNPDDPGRAVNSPHNCYQVSPEALAVIRLMELDSGPPRSRAFRNQGENLRSAMPRPAIRPRCRSRLPMARRSRLVQESIVNSSRP